MWGYSLYNWCRKVQLNLHKTLLHGDKISFTSSFNDFPDPLPRKSPHNRRLGQLFLREQSSLDDYGVPHVPVVISVISNPIQVVSTFCADCGLQNCLKLNPTYCTQRSSPSTNTGGNTCIDRKLASIFRGNRHHPLSEIRAFCT